MGNQTLVTSFRGKRSYHCTIPAYVILNLPVFSCSSASVIDHRMEHILTLEILDLSSPNSLACWQYSCVSQSPSWVQFPLEIDFWLPRLSCLEMKSDDQFWRNLSMTIQPAKSRVKELSKMYQDPVLWAWLDLFLGTNSKTTPLLSYSFWTKTAFRILTKRYDEHPLPFLYVKAAAAH